MHRKAKKLKGLNWNILIVTVNVLIILYCLWCKGKSPRQSQTPFDTIIIVYIFVTSWICRVRKWKGGRKESCLFTWYSHIECKKPWSDLYKWCYCNMHKEVREWKTEREQIEMLCISRANMKQIWRLEGQHWRSKTDLISR